MSNEGSVRFKGYALATRRQGLSATGWMFGCWVSLPATVPLTRRPEPVRMGH